MKFLSMRSVKISRDIENYINNTLSEDEERWIHSFSPTLCHCDLHSDNLLKRGNKLYLIDWEYSGMSHPFCDLASISSLGMFSVEETIELLYEYRPEATIHDCLFLLHLKNLFEIRWYLWCLVEDLYYSSGKYKVWKKNLTETINKKACLFTSWVKISGAREVTDARDRYEVIGELIDEME